MGLFTSVCHVSHTRVGKLHFWESLHNSECPWLPTIGTLCCTTMGREAVIGTRCCATLASTIFTQEWPKDQHLPQIILVQQWPV